MPLTYTVTLCVVQILCDLLSAPRLHGSCTHLCLLQQSLVVNAKGQTHVLCTPQYIPARSYWWACGGFQLSLHILSHGSSPVTLEFTCSGCLGGEPRSARVPGCPQRHQPALAAGGALCLRSPSFTRTAGLLVIAVHHFLGCTKIYAKTLLLLDIHLMSPCCSSAHIILTNILIHRSLACDDFLRKEF